MNQCSQACSSAILVTGRVQVELVDRRTARAGPDGMNQP
jgi:hypothetical protein